jgi:undecaprenol kinase
MTHGVQSPILAFLKSLSFAFRGFKWALSERNFKIQLVIAVLVFVFAFLLKVSRVEWYILIVCVALVLSFEMINTALERLSDSITTAYHPLIKEAKDLAAGAVLVFALGAATIGLVIFIPKLWAIFLG